ncbi:hypothetical protein KCV87_01520 [Actinosynnema pretiosum subsp. pretiosum]|uniref:Uncharacterized protein n=2 Tax=Actinosynnema TaxID=40566 RepID=C6WD23_ACTMD|nr:hypothetical protein [Actinosynnema mirum]ACU37642.1 hypothetical protein Amir_3759 [Actinosynnema mirum DSM 43827]AXX31072.1 hypothetical protein APASM_3707 [Actinosynnema pretiosum subsp. pretiosum]QUF04844.1 hypothetical protein KCV87_01520 [Actinosynnema pretiosum subsp. pretiosum]
MIHPAPIPRPDEVGDRAETMARFLREVPLPFTRVLSLWVGYGVRREPRLADRVHHLTARQGRLLGGLPEGTPVTRREGYLVPGLGPSGPRLAAVTALLHQPALHLDAPRRAELANGCAPLGTLLSDVRRVTHYAWSVTGPTDDADPDLEDPLPDLADDVPALRCQATLLSCGRPVALARETVYEAALLARRPPDLLPHLRSGPYGVVS